MVVQEDSGSVGSSTAPSWNVVLYRCQSSQRQKTIRWCVKREREVHQAQWRRQVIGFGR